MAFSVIVKQEAHQDTVEAYHYYEEKQSGLGERFLEALSRRYQELSENPAYFSFIAEDNLNILRDVRLEKFPHVVVYEIMDDEMIVFAVIQKTGLIANVIASRKSTKAELKLRKSKYILLG